MFSNKTGGSVERSIIQFKVNYIGSFTESNTLYCFSIMFVLTVGKTDLWVYVS